MGYSMSSLIFFNIRVVSINKSLRARGAQQLDVVGCFVCVFSASHRVDVVMVH